MSLQVFSPYTRPVGRWYRGNLHAHTTQSDGIRTPEELVGMYAERGYDWLAITDHDQVTPPPASAPICVLSGNEITARGSHILHVGATRPVEPLRDRSWVVLEASSLGGLVILNHPRWETTFNHWPLEQIEALPRKFTGIEIYNGIVRRQEGSCLATDRWDQLLSREIPCWGFANDDAHEDIDVGNAWNCVQCESLDPSSIIDSISAGRFYASTGVVIDAIETEGSRILIRSRNGGLCVPVMDWGAEMGRFPGCSWEFDLCTLGSLERPSYIRFEIHGDIGTMAWTQPIRLKWA